MKHGGCPLIFIFGIFHLKNFRKFRIQSKIFRARLISIPDFSPRISYDIILRFPKISIFSQKHQKIISKFSELRLIKNSKKTILDRLSLSEMSDLSLTWVKRSFFILFVISSKISSKMITEDVRYASGWVIIEQKNYALELYLVIIIIFWAIRNVMIECKAFVFL